MRWQSGSSKEPAALQEVLVVRVDPSADVARGAEPFARLDVDLFADEPERRAARVEARQGLLRLVVEHRLSGQLRERAELQQQRADLRRVRPRAGRLPGLQIDVHVGHPGGRRKRRQEPGAQVFRQQQEARIAGRLVGGEQASEDADRDLEVLHRDVLVEGELLEDQRPSPGPPRLSEPIRSSVSRASTGVMRRDCPCQSCAVRLTGLSSSWPHAYRS